MSDKKQSLDEKTKTDTHKSSLFQKIGSSAIKALYLPTVLGMYLGSAVTNGVRGVCHSKGVGLDYNMNDHLKRMPGMAYTAVTRRVFPQMNSGYRKTTSRKFTVGKIANGVLSFTGYQAGKLLGACI